MQTQNNSIGAIWIKSTKNGDKYYSVNFNGEWYNIFKNTNKTDPKQPDFKILKSEKKDSATPPPLAQVQPNNPF